MSIKERRFFVNGKIYTLYEYGFSVLFNFYKESKEETANPNDMSKKEIEEWALYQLEDAIKQDDQEIYELQ